MKPVSTAVKKIILLSLFVSPLAFADDAPVVSLSPSGATESQQQAQVVQSAPVMPTAVPAATPLTLDQRVAVLERQISAMNQIDLVNQVSHLEQQVQDLQGQVQVLSHTLQTVQTQTTSQYADLDQRLQAQKTTQTAATTTSTTPDANATTTTAADSSADEQKLYDAAYKNIREQRNADGIDGLKKYLAKYPDGKYAASAHYWLGQLYILKGDDKSVKSAVTEFDTVIKKYPSSDKAKEANLKLGFAYLLQNKNKEAKLQFHKIMKDYPGTSTAQLAEARLAQLS